MAVDRLTLGVGEIGLSLFQVRGQTFLNRANIDHHDGTATAEVVDLTGKPYSFLGGHTFDGQIVVPGVTQLKMMADLLRLWGNELDITRRFILSEAENIRFRGIAIAGEALQVELMNIRRTEDLSIRAEGKVTRGTSYDVVAEGVVTVRPFSELDFRQPNFGGRLLEFSSGPPLYSGEQLDELLPQKPPFRFVQSLTGLEPGVSGQGALVDTSLPYYRYLLASLRGHKYIPPEFLIEASAQVGTAVALSVEGNRGKTPLFGAINQLVVHGLLDSGERALVGVDDTRMRGPVGRGKGWVRREDLSPILDCELVFALRDPTTP